MVSNLVILLVIFSEGVNAKQTGLLLPVLGHFTQCLSLQTERSSWGVTDLSC